MTQARFAVAFPVLLIAIILPASLCMVHGIYPSPPPGFPPGTYYMLLVFSDYGVLAYNPEPLVTEYGYVVFEEGTVVTVTVSSDLDSNSSYTRFIFNHVEGEGDGSYSGNQQVFEVKMYSDIVEDIYWTTQYWISFDTSGISGETGSSTIVTIDGDAKTADDLPFVGWFDAGATIAFTYAPVVAGTLTYTLVSKTVTYYDASGHLLSESLENSYTVWNTATITGTYTASTPEYGGTPTTTATTSTTSRGSSTSRGTGGARGEVPDILGGFADAWADFWSRMTGSGGRGGGSGSVTWLQGSMLLGIPNWMLVVALFLLILFLYKRDEDEKKKRRR